jgi:cellobiose epimerase
MDLKHEVAEHLTGKLIPFWEGLRDRENGGFYGYMDFDLNVDRQAAKGCILNSRILWFFARAYQTLGNPRALTCAKHAYAFMDRFWDPRFGGVYWSCAFDGSALDTTKHTYAQAFAIYGLCAYAKATGDREALLRATTLFELIQTHMSDSQGYLEAFDREFRPLNNSKLSDNPKMLARGLVAEKTMNTMLHIMEAYTLLYEVGRDERVKHALRALLMMMGERVYNRKENRLEVFFDPDLRSLLDMQSYGHDIEASWLIDLAADAALDKGERAEAQRLTTELAQGVLERAFRDGSLLNERVEGEDDATRVWWVQAETMVGMANLWQKTGDASLPGMLQQVWTYIKARLIDPREGSEWFWSVSDKGEPAIKPIVEPWKCPYHNGRMCLEIIARL